MTADAILHRRVSHDAVLPFQLVINALIRQPVQLGPRIQRPPKGVRIKRDLTGLIPVGQVVLHLRPVVKPVQNSVTPGHAESPLEPVVPEAALAVVGEFLGVVEGVSFSGVNFETGWDYLYQWPDCCGRVWFDLGIHETVDGFGGELLQTAVIVVVEVQLG